MNIRITYSSNCSNNIAYIYQILVDIIEDVINSETSKSMGDDAHEEEYSANESIE